MDSYYLPSASPQSPPLAPGYYPPPSYYPPQVQQDEVRTLFIAGLPDDVKPREIYNLFRQLPGYHSSHLNISPKSRQAFAFAVFSDQKSALSAMHALNGLIFDLEKEPALHIDLAKSNSRSKRSRTEDTSSDSLYKKVRGSVAFSRTLPESGVGSDFHMPGMGNHTGNMSGYSSTQSHGNINNGDRPPTKMMNISATPYFPQSNHPCATLFVANLGPTCSEQELHQVFSRCPGFLKLKMQNRHGAPIAFVDFQDVDCSAGALKHLQGTVLYSSVREGMTLEYAKTRMGMRKRERTAIPQISAAL